LWGNMLAALAQGGTSRFVRITTNLRKKKTLSS
jgi:hypothetical protein